MTAGRKRPDPRGLIAAPASDDRHRPRIDVGTNGRT
ncbi:UNVERIFIED_ORG: hypothetical protein CLV66_12428 [Actinomadura viridilutea]